MYNIVGKPEQAMQNSISRLRLGDTVCSLIFMKNITFLFFVQDPGMHAFNFSAKKVALACNSCASWVGRACNLIAVPAVNNPHTNY